MSELNDNSVLSQLYIEKEEDQLPVLYTVKEVAQILRTNTDYVQRLRKAKLLPFLKIGQYKVRKDALLDFLLKYEGFDLTNPFYVKEINDGET